MTKTTKRPQDLTRRNLRKTRRDLADLLARVRVLERNQRLLIKLVSESGGFWLKKKKTAK